MMHNLDVYLNDKFVGMLEVDADNHLKFSYHAEYAANPKSLPLSYALPLQNIAFNHRACRPFFSGILPEGNLRAILCRQLGISNKNDFALLTAIGGECAGAVTLLPSSSSLNDLPSDYKLLDKQSLIDILQTMHQRPMIAGEDGFRLSLAGAQDKLPVALIEGKIAIPVGRAPSTHIIKPVNRDFPSLIENECFCLKLAKNIGLNVCDVDIQHVDNQTYLLITRYDRIITNGKIQRLHQEDFCQALGIVPEMKYQREGGPSLSDCFQLIRDVSSTPVLDIKALLQGVLFNLIIGNNDAHGKNFSLLYHKNQVRLAPFYDMISTAYYPNLSTKMAMKIGSKYEFDTLFPRHVTQAAEAARLSKAMTTKLLEDLLKKVEATIPDSAFTKTILTRAEKLEQRLNQL